MTRLTTTAHISTRLMAAMALVLHLTNCGKDQQCKDTKAAEGGTSASQCQSDVKSASSPTTANIAFSGYVQKAFSLTVNGNQFQDSEDFYTHFIDKLVKPQYPDLQPDNVTVNGAYGLDEFGTNSGVYMASMASAGHLFQAVTDAQSKFIVQVQPSAQDETYQAKVVIRIGLDIKSATKSDTYCYLLLGLKQGIAITDTAKPIIFDTFTTELDTYKCEQVQDSQIVIPGLTPGTASGTATGTSTAAGPSVSVPTTITVSSPLGQGETGKNQISAISYSASDRKFYIAKTRVLNSATGQYVIPIDSVAVAPGGTTTRVTSITATNPAQAVGDMVGVANFSSGILGAISTTVLNLYPTGNGTPAQVLDLSAASTIGKGNPIGACSGDGAIGQYDMAIFSAGTQLQTYLYGCDALCTLTPTAVPALSSCTAVVKGPNDCGPPRVISAASSGANVALQSTGYTGCGNGTAAIVTLNSSNVVQQTYPVSPVLISADDFSNGRLASDGTTLYLVTSSGDNLVFRVLTLSN